MFSDAAFVFAVGVAQVVDFYLDSARQKELAEIKVLITKTDPESTEKLRGYIREAMRTYSALRCSFEGRTWLT